MLAVKFLGVIRLLLIERFDCLLYQVPADVEGLKIVLRSMVAASPQTAMGEVNSFFAVSASEIHNESVNTQSAFARV